MLLKDTIKQIVDEQKVLLTSIDIGIERECLNDITISEKFVNIITGIRRCGKSTLLNQLMSRYKNVFYFNFEDVRAFGFELSDFTKLEEIFQSYSDEGIFFFDEIQNVPEWERYVRTLMGKGKSIIITGSSASLLSRELGTKLTGRHLNHELYPFSFSEFLKLNKKNPSAKTFESYLQNGGFPEYLKIGEGRILQELFNDIITRDIIVRYNLRQPKIVKELALYLLSNVGKEFSYRKLSQTYESGSVNTIISLISYYEESYLLFTVPRFDFSYKKQIVNPKKIYAIDPGMIKMNTVSFTNDQGRILENMVYLFLRRSGKEVFYFKQKNECDFITKSKDGLFAVYQVCYKLTEDNKQREINGLLEAMEYLKLESGKIITIDQEEILKTDKKEISVIPAWKMMS